ncbi:hypothetical protein CDAR_475661 [Caerostris darwini]|uniref:Uncharacterized protein n=1 Tax=Caerostris darwini TaxID=1538125 RepID=A0AAV4P9W1_9ARAC|nr:hypothetical protein CDAR_475661 [Caerostris darwini]
MCTHAYHKTHPCFDVWYPSACRNPQTITKGCFVSGICRSVATSLAKSPPGVGQGWAKINSPIDMIVCFIHGDVCEQFVLSLAIPLPLLRRPTFRTSDRPFPLKYVDKPIVAVFSMVPSRW